MGRIRRRRFMQILPAMTCTYTDENGEEKEFNLLIARLEGKYV